MYLCQLKMLEVLELQVTDFDANNLKKGDLIVYSSPSQGSDSHVVIYDGNGGYYGNNSSNNITMHGDNYNIEGTDTAENY